MAKIEPALAHNPRPAACSGCHPGPDILVPIGASLIFLTTTIVIYSVERFFFSAPSPKTAPLGGGLFYFGTPVHVVFSSPVSLFSLQFAQFRCRKPSVSGVSSPFGDVGQDPRCTSWPTLQDRADSFRSNLSSNTLPKHNIPPPASITVLASSTIAWAKRFIHG